ncbi:MAG: TatD family hydrolase [Lysobacterales bacterium]
MQLIDIGANLSHESFAHDLSSVLDHARAVGIAQIVVTGASEQASLDAHALAQQWPRFLYATAGVHPHHAGDYTADTHETLRGLHRHADVVAVGETGLDYFRDLSPRATQQFAFEQQLELALECGKPLFLHQRDAHDDFIAILRQLRDRLGACVVHCFTADKRELYECLDLDCHIGITGWICDERRGTHLIPLMKDIPANRLMIETDAPYLLPRTIRPKPKTHRNEPRYLPQVLQAVAEARGESIEQLAASTTATAREFFRLPR